MIKKCSKCKVNDRRITNKGIIASWCSECVSKQSISYYQRYKEKVDKKNTEWVKNNRERSYQINTKSRNKRRLKILTYYSNGLLECACCKEKNYEFLTIDHIDGGGTQHRKDIGSGGQTLYSWIFNNGFPEGFRVLCYNCNSCLGHYHYCPHQKIYEKN